MIFDRETVTGKVSQGLIADAIIRPAGQAHVWTLEFVCIDGTRERMTRARKAAVKDYKSIEAAFNDVNAVGLNKAVIEMS